MHCFINACPLSSICLNPKKSKYICIYYMYIMYRAWVFFSVSSKHINLITYSLEPKLTSDNADIASFSPCIQPMSFLWFRLLFLPGKSDQHVSVPAVCYGRHIISAAIKTV